VACRYHDQRKTLWGWGGGRGGGGGPSGCLMKSGKSTLTQKGGEKTVHSNLTENQESFRQQENKKLCEVWRRKRGSESISQAAPRRIEIVAGCGGNEDQRVDERRRYRKKKAAPGRGGGKTACWRRV